MNVGVIVITYNSSEHVPGALWSVLAQRPHLGQDLVVWDNASTDRSAVSARDVAPGIRIVKSAANVGFAAAVNRAAEMLSGRNLLLLNPDAVIGPGVIDALESALASSPEVAVAGVRLFDADGRAQSDSWRFPSPGRSALGAAIGLGRAYRPVRSVIDGGLEDVGDAFVPFTACLLSRDWFDRIGGMDERFWLYGEDADYGYRARRAGGRVVVCREVGARHVGGASSESRVRANAQIAAGHRFRRLHWGSARAEAARWAIVAGAAARVGMAGLATWVGVGRPGLWAEWRQVLQQRADGGG